MTSPLEISFKARLRNIAREKRLDPAELWQNLVLERLLVRICQSRFASQFILKGGVLLSKYVNLNRRTQDLDFTLRDIESTPAHLEKILQEISTASVDDGFKFEDLKTTPVSHPHMKQPGVRARMRSIFGRTRFLVSIDFGCGDLVEPIVRSFPLISGSKGALLESSIQMHCYPQEFIFAEKLEAIVYLGTENSRMKDYHDLYLLIQSETLPMVRVETVIKSVFKHRQTSLRLPLIFPADALQAFEEFWGAHLRTLSKSHPMPAKFADILTALNTWLREKTSLCRTT